MTVIVRPAEVADLPAILAIYNDAVANTTAIWNDAEVDLANRQTWLEGRRKQDYPVLVAEEDGAVVGYGSFGDFRAFDGYRFSVEHSVYVAEGSRRQGVASALIEALAARASDLGKRVMIGGIAGDNVASLRLHAKLGFTETGRMPEVGFKFGRWLDLVFMQKRL
ncbi:MAG: GNAT family N-acetyltransferase [Bauldia sp.]|nr:GNAT family N-acetyltransferase [Bauldia sp.]